MDASVHVNSCVYRCLIVYEARVSVFVCLSMSVCTKVCLCADSICISVRACVCVCSTLVDMDKTNAFADVIAVVVSVLILGLRRVHAELLWDSVCDVLVPYSTL